MEKEKLGQVDLSKFLMVTAIITNRKLGQVDLINISAGDLHYGWTQTVFLPSGQYSLTRSVALHTSMKMTIDHMDPVTGVTNKGLSPDIHAEICPTVLIVICSVRSFP